MLQKIFQTQKLPKRIGYKKMEHFLRNLRPAVIFTFLEALVTVHFVLKFQGFSFKSVKGIIKLVLSSLLFSLFMGTTYELLPQQWAMALANAAFLFIISLVLTKEKMYLKLLAPVIYVIVNTAEELIIPYDFEELSFRVVLLAINIIVYSVILQIAGRDKIGLGKKEWLLIFLVLGLSFGGVALLSTVNDNNGENMLKLFGTEACIIASAAVSFYMTVLLSRSQKESEQLKLISQENEFRLQYAENAKKQYDEIRRIRHDMKQTYSVILSLLKEGKTEEAFDFIGKSAEQTTAAHIFIDAGNDIINALLNAKLSQAKQLGINVLCSMGADISKLDPVDMCNLLGNMLDNAIEACEKCTLPQRIITLDIQRLEEQYLIGVTNSFSGDINEESSFPVTSKKNKELHGFGVRSIVSIAEKYGGTAAFTQEEDIFRCDVVLNG